MDFKSSVLKCIAHSTSTPQQNTLLVLLFQLLLASLTIVSVKGCFPYHRGKVETSIIKLEHIDKVRLYSPYAATGSLDQAAAYRQAQSPNVSVIVNFILPSSNSDQKSGSSENKNKSNSTFHIDKRTQQRLAETVNNVLYGQRPK